MIEAFYVGIDIAKGVHHIFCDSMDIIFTGTVIINYFLEEHTNAQRYVSKKVLPKQYTLIMMLKMKIVLLLPANTDFKMMYLNN